MLCNDTPLVFMRLGLKSFRIERLSPVQSITQIFCLMVQICISTIFRQHQFLPRVFLLQPFYPRLDILQLFLIPSEVAVHSLNIRILIDRMLCMAITIYRYSVAVRILCLGQIMQSLCQSCRIFVGLVYFIVQSPYINGRVIETLTNQFTKLRLCIFGFISCHPIHKRNLCPDDQSQRIATGIQVIRLLIVGETDSSCSDIHNLSQVEIMFFVGKRTTQSPPILMTGYPIHRVFLTIQVETFAYHNLISTNTQWLYHLINYFSVRQ